MDCIERDLLSVIPLFVWQKDCEGRYKYANPAFCAWVGRSVDDVLGRTDHEIWDEATETNWPLMRKESPCAALRCKNRAW